MSADFPVDHLSDQRAPAPIPDAAISAQLLRWEPWAHSTNSSLAGHATIAFPGGWTIGRIPIFRAPDGAVSAGVPTVPELDSDGRARTRPDGSRAYSPIVTFASAAAKLRWQRAVLGALAQAGIAL